VICYLDFDDAWKGNMTFQVNNALNKLYKHFPKFRVNLFVPGGLEMPEYITDREIFSYCLHGWAHKHDEILTDYKLKIWKGAKVYRAPFWQLPDEMYRRLHRHGYKIMLNPEVKDTRIGIRFNWNLKDNPPLDEEVIIGHGHIKNVCGNGILESFERIMMLPQDTEFKFLRDLA
jgi:hypothetical protein